ncbi:VWA domain-containing protein [Corynebacterium pelargi]|uniref:Uncharacterized protein n=1 Tax=Corynebacterium pelargi TaxID=1471400 RepID=A0A410W8Z4_9CORY|nr:VWA domain-containing protein [Corynebacterium pelargi]QAU52420.1 hypothetical protein CPELA_05745 [Corynebacterium pelargi]GGG67812.1 hypothetical protein GCM10007338_00470 [Corynebacterium pelargi]
MGQHSSGKPNYRLSQGLVITLLAVVLVIAAVLLWSNQRIRSDEEHRAQACIEGELVVPIATHGMIDAEWLIKRFADANPQTQDFCLEPQLVDDPAQAALLLSAETDLTIKDVLARSDRQAASNQWPIVATLAVGVADRNGQPWNPEMELRYPTSPDAVASALLAAQKFQDYDSIYAAIEQDRGLDIEQASTQDLPYATSQGFAADGWQFMQADGVEMPVRGVVLNANDQVSEDAQRGADAIVQEFQQDKAKELDPTVVEVLNAFGSPLQTTQRSQDTLFLLDTSEASGPWAEQAREAIADAVAALGTDHDAALLNYSSPLNPGVVQGWRPNVLFDDELSISQAVRALGIGGVPQTHEALLAALNIAQEHATPTTVVLLSTGSVDDADVRTALADAAQRDIHVHLIELGDQSDAALAQAIEEHGGSVTRVTDPAELDTAVHRAVGLS